MKNGCHLAESIIFILFVIYLSGGTNSKWKEEVDKIQYFFNVCNHSLSKKLHFIDFLTFSIIFLTL